MSSMCNCSLSASWGISVQLLITNRGTSYVVDFIESLDQITEWTAQFSIDVYLVLFDNPRRRRLGTDLSPLSC